MIGAGKVRWYLSVKPRDKVSSDQGPISWLCLSLNSALMIAIPGLRASASFVNIECLVMWSTQALKPKFAANPKNTLVVSTQFPASVSADAVLKVQKSHEIRPWLFHILWNLRYKKIIDSFSKMKLVFFLHGFNALCICVGDVFGQFIVN